MEVDADQEPCDSNALLGGTVASYSLDFYRLQYHVVSLHRFFWTARLCDSASIWINNTSGRSFFLIVKQWLADLLRESCGEKYLRVVVPLRGAIWSLTVNRDCTSLVRRLWFLSSSLGLSLSEPPPLSTLVGGASWRGFLIQINYELNAGRQGQEPGSHVEWRASSMARLCAPMSASLWDMWEEEEKTLRTKASNETDFERLGSDLQYRSWSPSKVQRCQVPTQSITCKSAWVGPPCRTAAKSLKSCPSSCAVIQEKPCQHGHQEWWRPTRMCKELWHEWRRIPDKMLRHPSRKLGQWKKIPHLSVEHTVNLKVNLPHPKPVVNLQRESRAGGTRIFSGAASRSCCRRSGERLVAPRPMVPMEKLAWQVMEPTWWRWVFRGRRARHFDVGRFGKCWSGGPPFWDLRVGSPAPSRTVGRSPFDGSGSSPQLTALRRCGKSRAWPTGRASDDRRVQPTQLTTSQEDVLARRRWTAGPGDGPCHRWWADHSGSHSLGCPSSNGAGLCSWLWGRRGDLRWDLWAYWPDDGEWHASLDDGSYVAYSEMKPWLEIANVMAVDAGLDRELYETYNNFENKVRTFREARWGMHQKGKNRGFFKPKGKGWKR